MHLSHDFLNHLSVEMRLLSFIRSRGHPKNSLNKEHHTLHCGWHTLTQEFLMSDHDQHNTDVGVQLHVSMVIEGVQ